MGPGRFWNVSFFGVGDFSCVSSCLSYFCMFLHTWEGLEGPKGSGKVLEGSGRFGDNLKKRF